LAQLPSHLNASFVDPLFNCAEFSLHLLNIRPRVGEGRAEAIDIGVQSTHVGPQPPLLPLEQLNLLRINAGRQPDCARERQTGREFVAGYAKVHGTNPTTKSSGPEQ
jgi:hypothetical protein